LFEFGWEKEDCKEIRLRMKKTDSPQSTQRSAEEQGLLDEAGEDG
jgi:hypothetical protein